MKKLILLAPMALLAGCNAPVAEFATPMCLKGVRYVITGRIYKGVDGRAYLGSDSARVVEVGKCDDKANKPDEVAVWEDQG